MESTQGRHSHPVDADRVALAREHVLARERAGDLAEVFRALGDPVRARIASALASAELCVGDIALAIDASENVVSYALRQLRSAGLVARERRGRLIYYRLADPRVRDLVELGGSVSR